MISKFFMFLQLLMLVSTICCIQASSNHPLSTIDKVIKSSYTIADEIKSNRRRTTTIDQDGIYHKTLGKVIGLRCGNIFAGWNPFGYGITKLGLEFLEWDGSLDSDIGRFLASFKSGRKREKQMKEQWLEIVRVAKSGQSMRIYRKMDDLLLFCVKAGFLA